MFRSVGLRKLSKVSNALILFYVSGLRPPLFTSFSTLSGFPIALFGAFSTEQPFTFDILKNSQFMSMLLPFPQNFLLSKFILKIALLNWIINQNLIYYEVIQLPNAKSLFGSYKISWNYIYMSHTVMNVSKNWSLWASFEFPPPPFFWLCKKNIPD